MLRSHLAGTVLKTPRRIGQDSFKSSINARKWGSIKILAQWRNFRCHTHSLAQVDLT